MSDSILKGKKILIVDDETDVLSVLEEEIMSACADCAVEKAATYEAARACIESGSYDAVILDIMGVRGFELLDEAVKRGFKVAMLTAHALSPEALRHAMRMEARAYLPKDKLGEIVPFLEDVLRYDYEPGWKRLFERLYDFFASRFEKGWEKELDPPWYDWLRGKYL